MARRRLAGPVCGAEPLKSPMNSSAFYTNTNPELNWFRPHTVAIQKSF